MDRNRILELALETLENQKAEIIAEIERIRAGSRGRGLAVAGKTKAGTARKEKSRTPAQRRAQSQRMKKYWAAKRAKAAKGKTPTAKAKVRTKTDAEKRALSLKMKEVWRKRKAEAGTKNK
jgi:hypothetical protein